MLTPVSPTSSGVGAITAAAAARRASMATPVLLEGTVKKRGDGWGAGAFKARHFVLQGNRMEYFVARDGKKQGEVLLGPTSAVGPLGPKGFRVQSYAGARVFECEADSTAERDKWVAAIFAVIEGRVPVAGALSLGAAVPCSCIGWTRCVLQVLCAVPCGL